MEDSIRHYEGGSLTSAAYFDSSSAADRHSGVASQMAPNLAKGLMLIISGLSWAAEAEPTTSGPGGDLPAQTAMGIVGATCSPCIARQ